MSDLGWSYAATSKCWNCGHTYRLAPYGMQPTGLRKHRCWLHPLSCMKWQAYLEGWHSAHRNAVENLDDPMLLADAEDYGTGWAGLMRTGGLTFLAEGDES